MGVPKEFRMTCGIEDEEELEVRRNDAADFLVAYLDYVRRTEPYATLSIRAIESTLDGFPQRDDEWDDSEED